MSALRSVLLTCLLLAGTPLSAGADEPAPMPNPPAFRITDIPTTQPWVEVSYTDISIYAAGFPSGVAAVTCSGVWLPVSPSYVVRETPAPPNTMWCAKVPE